MFSTTFPALDASGHAPLDGFCTSTSIPSSGTADPSGGVGQITDTASPTLYPALIKQACSLIDEIPAWRDYPDSCLRVLLRLIKKINLENPFAPIFAKRETLATESNKSIETVYRTIRLLEADFLLETRCMKTRPGKKGSSSPLIPTQKLLQLLQLDAKSIAEWKANFQGHASARGSFSAQSGAINTVPLIEHVTPNLTGNALVADEEIPSNDDLVGIEPVAEATHATCTQVSTTTLLTNVDPATSPETRQARANSRGYVLRQGCIVPKDLIWLVDRQSVRAPAILKLMGIARKQKQRLSDVVAANKKYLVDLTGNAVYAYIRKLLTLGTDFTAKVQEVNKETNDAALREYLRDKARNMHGRYFYSSKTKIVYQVDESGFVLWTNNGVPTSSRFTQKFLDGIESRIIVPYRA